MKQKYQFFTAKEVKPRGWLRDQLAIQAKGLSGDLDRIWPDIRDSAWIGGDRDGWERVPYWLDGFIPLAYLLEDQDMIARAQKYVDAILAGQRPDGWICPCEDDKRGSYDLWAMFLICKVLVVYHDCTGDERIPGALSRALQNLKALLDSGESHLFEWGKFRWFEALIPISWLYGRCGEDWLLSLARTLREQGADYSTLMDRWEIPLNQWHHETHIVNLCMMLKYEALSSALLGERYENKAERLWRQLDRYNGTAAGVFTGDECLSGIGAIHGTELCSVVEQMYSCEWLYAVTGDPVWADRLELAAFNALPATISDDMWTHQYVQMANQISCEAFQGKSLFRTNGPESHLFGLEPNFGCCTANFNQGWPKFALSAFMGNSEEIVSVSPVPAGLSTRIKDAGVRITVETEYPFEHTALYRVETDRETEFTLRLRAPGWAETVELDGREIPLTKEIALRRKWSGTTQLRVTYGASPKLVSRPERMKCARYGALLFALPIETEYRMREYERDGVERKFPYCDYELAGKSPWSFGFADGELRAESCMGDEIPFSSKHPRVMLTANLCPIGWGYEDGYDNVCARLPKSRKALDAPRPVGLIPYGCAKLRMTEMPLVRK